MQSRLLGLASVLTLSLFLYGCGGTGTNGFNQGNSGTPPAAPTISTTAAQDGAVIVTRPYPHPAQSF
ncbi:MAG: hypothetical protein ACRD3B_08140, partial [Candidatus Sulfotelmatobacter sp.]